MNWYADISVSLNLIFYFQDTAHEDMALNEYEGDRLPSYEAARSTPYMNCDPLDAPLELHTHADLDVEFKPSFPMPQIVLNLVRVELVKN